MRRINQYIIEKLKINKSKLKGGTEYELFPENLGELERMIREEIKKNGNNCSLNHIDVSKLTNFSYLFYTDYLKKFNGDISDWDVSNATNMEGLFFGTDFNGDISEWDVSNVTNMSCMFYSSKFNGDISQWNVSNVKDMSAMFARSKFNQDISKWDVSNVGDIRRMFEYSKFNQDISNWNINKRMPIDKMLYVFKDCDIKNEYKPDIYRD